MKKSNIVKVAQGTHDRICAMSFNSFALVATVASKHELFGVFVYAPEQAFLTRANPGPIAGMKAVSAGDDARGDIPYFPSVDHADEEKPWAFRSGALAALALAALAVGGAAKE